jgi:hypothetical protein
MEATEAARAPARGEGKFCVTAAPDGAGEAADDLDPPFLAASSHDR